MVLVAGMVAARVADKQVLEAGVEGAHTERGVWADRVAVRGR